MSLKLLVHHVTLFLSFCTKYVESIICFCIHALYVNSYIFRTVPQKLLCTGGILKICTSSPGEGLLCNLLNDYLELNFCTHVTYTWIKSNYYTNTKIFTKNMSSTSALLRTSFHVYLH